MPLDRDKVRQAVDKADSLSKRVDAFLARRTKRDADKAQKKADKARRDAESLDPSEKGLNAATSEYATRQVSRAATRPSRPMVL
jgi:hypothetical protein